MASSSKSAQRLERSTGQDLDAGAVDNADLSEGVSPEPVLSIEEEFRDYMVDMIAQLEQMAIRLKEVEVAYHLRSAKESFSDRALEQF